jgi:CHAT domain-containing protein
MRYERRAAGRALCAVALALAAYSFACSRVDRASEAYEAARGAYIRGELAQAAKSAAENQEKWRTSSPLWFWRFRLLTAEVLTTQSQFAQVEALLKEQAPDGPEFAQLAARQWLDRANVAIAQHRDGGAAIAQARQMAKDPEILMRLDLVEGALAMDRREHVLAEKLFHAALERAAREHNANYEALALNNLSVAAKRLNRYEESIRFAQSAIEAAQRSGAQRSAALAEGNLGAAYAYLGDFETALRHEQTAVALNRTMGAKSLAMLYLGELGLIYDRAARVQEAIPAYREAFETAAELGLKRDGARFAENLALALIEAERWNEAAQWNDRAWQLAGESGALASLPYLTRNRARIAWGRGHPEEAAGLCRELLRTGGEQPSITWEAYELLGEIDTAGKRFAAANGNYERALRLIETTRSDVLDPRYRVTFLSRMIGFYHGYVDALVAQGNDAKALAVAESSRARVLSERLGRNVVPASASGARPSGASILAFWVAPRRSYAWLITPAAVRRFDLPPAAEIEALVTAYRGVVEHSVADPMDEPAGKALWEKLLAPVAREIPAGSRLLVVPDGPLHRLNLETLPVPGAKPHYWIEDVEVAVAPSVSLALAAPESSAAAGSLLLIGGPDYSGTGYEALPGAAVEVEELRKRFANTSPAVITGKQASPAAYRAANPSRYSLIHFAAHAEANSEKPLESAVVLSRAGDSYKLYASEVIDVPIHADLVTISGCRAAGARAYAGEGLIGFAWAFLHAGARSVVAGLWDVSDGVTAPLMAAFYDGILARRPPAAALREAKLRLLRDGRHAKPFYWGAFQTYVGGGAKPSPAVRP